MRSVPGGNETIPVEMRSQLTRLPFSTSRMNTDACQTHAI
jgi:hypothetical protein